MGIVHGEIAGVPVMICRLSFSGEMAFEVYCGAGHGTPCLGGADRGRQAVRPGALRAGGAGHAAHREGPCHRRRDRRPHHGARPASRLDAVEEEAVHRLGDDGPRRAGRRRPACAGRAGRRSTTGRSTAARTSSNELDEADPHGSIGHISAACYSPALGRYIALALVEGGKARHGTRAFVSDPLRRRFGPVEIVSHHFFDPRGQAACMVEVAIAAGAGVAAGRSRQCVQAAPASC